MNAPWTMAHQREALRRTYEIAAELAGRGGLEDQDEAGRLGRIAAAHLTEAAWRRFLGGPRSHAGPRRAGRIDREVRRVRELAEGRLVRETFHGVRIAGDPTVYRRTNRAEAFASAHAQRLQPSRAVRVTRIGRPR